MRISVKTIVASLFALGFIWGALRAEPVLRRIDFAWVHSGFISRLDEVPIEEQVYVYTSRQGDRICLTGSIAGIERTLAAEIPTGEAVPVDLWKDLSLFFPSRMGLLIDDDLVSEYRRLSEDAEEKRKVKIAQGDSSPPGGVLERSAELLSTYISLNRCITESDGHRISYCLLLPDGKVQKWEFQFSLLLSLTRMEISVLTPTEEIRYVPPID